MALTYNRKPKILPISQVNARAYLLPWFIRPSAENYKPLIENFGFLVFGKRRLKLLFKDLHIFKILRRDKSVKYIYNWIFHFKLPDFLREFLACFVESLFFYYNRIACNAPPESSSRCFCKRRVPLLKRPWNWNDYSVRHLWLHLWMSQQSVMFVSEPCPLQRSR